MECKHCTHSACYLGIFLEIQDLSRCCLPQNHILLQNQIVILHVKEQKAEITSNFAFFINNSYIVCLSVFLMGTSPWPLNIIFEILRELQMGYNVNRTSLYHGC